MQQICIIYGKLSVRPKNVSASCFSKLFGRIFCRNCFCFLDLISAFLQKQFILAEMPLFRKKYFNFGRNCSFRQKPLFWQSCCISAETDCFCRNSIIWHYFGISSILAEQSASAEIETCRNAEMPKEQNPCFGPTLVKLLGITLQLRMINYSVSDIAKL